MQKVEGSNPFSRFAEIPLSSGISLFMGFGSVRLCWVLFPPLKGR